MVRLAALCLHVQNLRLILLDHEERELDRTATRISEETLDNVQRNISRKRDLWSKVKRRILPPGGPRLPRNAECLHRT
eukprot:2732643-Pyramimonas_sp.AAC.1